MLKKFGLVAALSIMAAAPALAQNSCGDEPFPPALATAAEVGQKTPADAAKAKHQAFLDIKAWQGQLKDYRDCLDSTQSTVQRQLKDAQTATKPDQDKIKGLQAQIDAAKQAYARSTDSEERVVNDFHALSTAFCSRTDVDKTTCPKT
jgi:predicted outer membrane protein